MKEYYNNTYQSEIECTVTETEKTDTCMYVYTDRTICYPECGGQPGDRGTLGEFPILDTKKADNGDSIHILSKDSNIKVGQTLTMTLDWEHRYKFMVMHTAQHMLSGLLFNEFNIGTVSVHLGDDYLTIETNQESIPQETIDKLVLIANDKIAEAHKIVYHEMSHSDAEALGMRRSIKVEGDVRIVEIQDVDRIACGGVHASCTSELRLILYIGQQKIRDHVRLFFVCGKDAQNTVYTNAKILDNLKNQLSCSAYSELAAKIEKNISQLEELKQKYKTLSEQTAYSEINGKLKDGFASFSTDTDPDAILKACDKFEDLCLCVQKDNNWLIVTKGKFSTIEFARIKEKVLMPLNAKGGGKNGVYQGICPSDITTTFAMLIAN